MAAPFSEAEIALAVEAFLHWAHHPCPPSRCVMDHDLHRQLDNCDRFRSSKCSSGCCIARHTDHASPGMGTARQGRRQQIPIVLRPALPDNGARVVEVLGRHIWCLPTSW